MGALIYRSFSPDPPAMPMDGTLNGHQPHSCAWKIAFRMQTLKNAKELARVSHFEAGAVVPNVISRPPIRCGYRPHFDPGSGGIYR